MRSHSVTCYPAEVTFPPLPQPKLVLDLATPEGCKAELTWDCRNCVARDVATAYNGIAEAMSRLSDAFYDLYVKFTVAVRILYVL